MTRNRFSFLLFICLGLTGDLSTNKFSSGLRTLLMDRPFPNCLDLHYYGNLSGESSCKCCDARDCFQGTECFYCPRGHYLEKLPCSGNTSDCDGNTTINLCHPCKQGYYQPEKQKHECLTCPPGYQTSSEGATVCDACPSGYFKNPSMTRCESCPAGQESLNTASSTCTPCVEGTHKSKEGPQLCEPCTSGYYVLTKEALFCLRCPAGFYCPCSKCGPVECPKRAYCPEQSSSPIYCSSPLYQWVTDGCYISTKLIGIIVAIILLSFLLMSVITARVYFRPQRCPSSTWTSLGEDSCSDPVYSGL